MTDLFTIRIFFIQTIYANYKKTQLSQIIRLDLTLTATQQGCDGYDQRDTTRNNPTLATFYDIASL